MFGLVPVQYITVTTNVQTISSSVLPRPRSPALRLLKDPCGFCADSSPGSKCISSKWRYVLLPKSYCESVSAGYVFPGIFSMIFFFNGEFVSSKSKWPMHAEK